MKKEQINWLREEPVELQDITIKEFKPFPVEATDLDLDNEIADTIHYLARINVLSKEIERLNNIINECAEDILKEIQENHHLSCGVALTIRQKLIDYREIKGNGSNE